MNQDSEAINNDGEIQSEYDFLGGVRGKYYQDYMRSISVVILDPDVADMVTRRWAEYGLADLKLDGADPNLFGYDIH